MIMALKPPFGIDAIERAPQPQDYKQPHLFRWAAPLVVESITVTRFSTEGEGAGRRGR